MSNATRANTAGVTVEEQNKARNKVVKEAITTAFEGVLAELKKLDAGAKCAEEFEPSGDRIWTHFKVDGCDVRVEFKPRFKKSYSYYDISKFLGTMDVVVGDYPDQKRFPPRKDGVACGACIAAQIVWCSEQAKSSKKNKVAFEKRKEELDEFVHQNNLSCGVRHRVGDNPGVWSEKIALVNNSNTIQLIVGNGIPAEKLAAILAYAKKELGV